MRLSHRDLTALISALPALYSPATLDLIPGKILLLVSALVPCFTATYDEWDVDREGRVHGYRAVQSPGIAEVNALLPELPLHIHDHPLFPSLQQGVTQPLKISDVATQSQFQQTKVYNEIYRHLGVHHQIVWFLPGQESPHVCLVLNRQRRDFSERDRQCCRCSPRICGRCIKMPWRKRKELVAEPHCVTARPNAPANW